MTIEDLADSLATLSMEQQKDFERAIRVLWANGKINEKKNTMTRLTRL